MHSRMKLTNLDRINVFGRFNRQMSPEAPHLNVDLRLGRLMSYLDMQIVKRWVLPALPINRRNDISVLDAGAGKGRMTRRLATVASHCVAIEPYPHFIDPLKAACPDGNVKLHPLSLLQYAEVAKEQFDFIFMSGVVTYHDDTEALQALHTLHNLLKPWGLVLLRDPGIEDEQYGVPPFGSFQGDGRLEVLRPPKGMQVMFSRAGYSCLKWRRVYPPNIPWALRQRWPCRLTDWCCKLCSSRLLYPAWEKLAEANLRHRKGSYFAYLLKRLGVRDDGASGHAVPL